MSSLEIFLSEHPNNFISKGKQPKSALKKISEELNFQTGPQLKNYLLNYGFLSFESVEIFGIGVKESGRLDIINETKNLKKNFQLPNGYIIIEKIGDGLTIVCDESDNVYEFIYNGEPNKLNIKFDEYLISRFTEL